jgi:hypothetical protein
MKKNIRILLLLVALVAVVFFVISRKNWSTLNAELKDFSIKDTAAITQFFLADKRGHSVTIAKNETGIWMVDNTYEADVSKVNLLLATMHDITVRNPVPEPAFNTVIGSLATEGVKVEFYEKNNLVKTIYVGSATPDQTGTFMMIEGSAAPFVTHIQGFVGYLTPRFYPYAIKWKGKKVFDVPFEKIASVKVDYPLQPNLSFELVNDKELLLKNDKGVLPIADKNFVQFYLSSFTNLYFEGYDEMLTGSKADSIHAIKPFCIVQLTQKDGSVIKLQVNYKKVGDHTKVLYDENGKLLLNDTEKYFAFLNGEKDVIYIQQYNFGKIFKTVNDFTTIGIN